METPAFPATLPSDPRDQTETGDGRGPLGPRGPAEPRGREHVFLGQKEMPVSAANLVFQVGGFEEVLGGFRGTNPKQTVRHFSYF